MENTSWSNFTQVLSELDGPDGGGDGEEDAGGSGRGGGGLRVLVGCILSLLIVSTLLGNTLVCAAVVRFRHLRSKVTNFFVISLAVSDLLVAVLVMPWEAITEVTGTWLFGRFCGVWIAFDIMCSTASILHLCIISVDRYWAIASPFKYERKMTQRVAFVMIGVAWLLSILISFIPVQLNWHQVEEEVMAEVVEMMAANSGGRNFTNSSNANAKSCVANLNKTYAISSSLISFYIPVVIMIATYTRIFRIAQTQIRRITSLERAAEQAQNHGHGANRNRQQQHDELVSYHHDTTLHKEALVPAATQQLPCNILVGANHLEDMSAQFDEESMISNGSRSCNRLLLLPATVQLEDDHEIWMESDALIPGQVVELKQSRGTRGPQRGRHPAPHRCLLQRRTHSASSVCF
ncbi:hypothetical protein FQN60_014690 [Etheostoma spectabile]|uniref:G-protein coupled receptors family 1 profile domain-containing protein n=1 Tax=Etheostoma spectabile TaxID=54343 RepID=A0A5J5CNG4_9PERO|nr:hypothetical protein FQN60_014690 [Etheostoma spectabile]